MPIKEKKNKVKKEENKSRTCVVFSGYFGDPVRNTWARVRKERKELNLFIVTNFVHMLETDAVDASHNLS